MKLIYSSLTHTHVGERVPDFKSAQLLSKMIGQLWEAITVPHQNVPIAFTNKVMDPADKPYTLNEILSVLQLAKESVQKAQPYSLPMNPASIAQQSYVQQVLKKWSTLKATAQQEASTPWVNGVSKCDS